MNTLLGQKKGTIELYDFDNKLHGFLNILNKCNEFSGERNKNGECTLNGKIVTLVQSIPYTAVGYADENEINLDVKCKKYTFQIHGSS